MRRVWLLVSFTVVLASPAWAQSNVEVNAGIQLDFLSPGARSLAMGSAFIGVADDATAAFTNPAGLRALSRMEVSFEARDVGFDIPVIAGGRFGGTPKSVQGDGGIDLVSGLIEDDQRQDGGGLGFVSFVYPRSRWAIAGFRHELAHFNSHVQTRGPFFEFIDSDADDPNEETRRFPIQGTLDLKIIAYGASGSFNVTPQFSVGAGLSFYDFKMDSRTDRFGINNAAFTNPVFRGPANYDPRNLQNFQTQDGEDTTFGVNVGALWVPNRVFQLGAVFRQGPDFDLRVTNNTTTARVADRSGRFHVPHVFGVGAAGRPFTNGMIVVDITRVLYSRTTDDFVDIFDDPPDGKYSIRNATEIHAGLEYVITTRIPIALRGGYWLDPAHSLALSGVTQIDNLARVEIFRDRNDDLHHATFGAGAVFGRLEVNGAGDISQRTSTASISAVFRF